MIGLSEFTYLVMPLLICSSWCCICSKIISFHLTFMNVERKKTVCVCFLICIGNTDEKNAMRIEVSQNDLIAASLHSISKNKQLIECKNLYSFFSHLMRYLNYFIPHHATLLCSHQKKKVISKFQRRQQFEKKKTLRNRAIFHEFGIWTMQEIIRYQLKCMCFGCCVCSQIFRACFCFYFICLHFKSSSRYDLPT